MNIKLENVLNQGIDHCRDAKSEHLDAMRQGTHIAQALEDMFIALALTNGYALDPQTERNSYASVRNPVAPLHPDKPADGVCPECGCLWSHAYGCLLR